MISAEIAVMRETQTVCRLQGMKTQSMKERLGGLLVLDKLHASQALWIEPCNSIHTIAMKYPLDLVYLDKHQLVCGLAENVKPWRISACWRAATTVEMLAGSIQQLKIQSGDRFQWLG